MACSSEEIEHKRRQAIEKMRARKSIGNNCLLNSSLANQYSPQNNLSIENSGMNGGPLRGTGYPKLKYQPYNRNTCENRLSISNTNDISTAKIISGTCYLISENRFEVDPSTYDDRLISVFKTIPSKSYDSGKRLWSFALEHYEELQRKILPLKPYIVIGTIPQYVLKIIQELPVNYNVDISLVGTTILNKLLPFQLDGVKFGIQKRGRCMIADDMGLGKTLQALAIAHYYKKDWPLLIVTTSSMRETWQSHIHELLPLVPTISIVCVSSGKEKICLTDSQVQVVIISYKMASLSTSHLVNKKFGVVILDESHLLKSYRAQATGCIMKITKYAKRVILLSGTPALSRPSELFTQLQIIEPKFFCGFTEFGKRYCAGKQRSFGWDMSGQSNLLELQAVLQKKFLIRRTKEDALPSLKEKTRETVILNPSLLAVNENIKNNLSQMAESYTIKTAAHKHTALLTFFCETAKVKIPAICKYVADVITLDQKFLIFAHHKTVIESICQTLDDHRVNYICIDGATKGPDRSSLVESFQFNDSCRCAVLSITATCAGITLTAAQLVIFAELHWNPGILNQAESRAHRIGQKSGVCVRYLLAKGTADDVMWPLLQKKLQVLNQTGLSNDTFENTTFSKQVTQANKNTLIKKITDNVQNNCNNLISGTNIQKGTEKNEVQLIDSFDVPNCLQEDNPEASFQDDIEGDELLAALLM